MATLNAASRPSPSGNSHVREAELRICESRRTLASSRAQIKSARKLINELAGKLKASEENLRMADEAMSARRL
jgi:hypothetical protein